MFFRLGLSSGLSSVAEQYGIVFDCRKQEIYLCHGCFRTHYTAQSQFQINHSFAAKSIPQHVARMRHSPSVIARVLKCAESRRQTTVQPSPRALFSCALVNHGFDGQCHTPRSLVPLPENRNWVPKGLHAVTCRFRDPYTPRLCRSLCSHNSFYRMAYITDSAAGRLLSPSEGLPGGIHRRCAAGLFCPLRMWRRYRRDNRQSKHRVNADKVAFFMMSCRECHV